MALTTYAAGTTVLQNPILLHAGSQGLACADPGQTAILQWAGTGPAVILNDDGTGFEGVVRNIKIELGSATSDGIRIGKSTGTVKSAQVLLENVWIAGSGAGTNGRRGVEFIAAQICTFTGLKVTGCDIGLAFVDDIASIANTACEFVGGRIDSCRVGAHIENGELLNFRGTTFQLCTQEGVLIYPIAELVKAIYLDHCWVEGNNSSRTSGPYGQVHVKGLRPEVAISGGVFWTHGTGNAHILQSLASDVRLNGYPYTGTTDTLIKRTNP